MISETIRAYLDLTRIHFFFVWPLLFCSGLFLSFKDYGGFTWLLVAKAALIALLGFEAGFILNDLVDAELDKRDIDNNLTKYWRPFGTRPLPSGRITKGKAALLFLLLFAAASAITFTIPYPNSAYVFSIMVLSYALEYFYQVKKKNQGFPLAQLIGRIDFSLFPVAGYLMNGKLDATAINYFIFFYPLAQVHLGINDIIDYLNDEVRQLKTITILYGVEKTKLWILSFSALHILLAYNFFRGMGIIMMYSLAAGTVLITVANILIIRGKEPRNWLKALPLIHVTLLIYIITMISDYFYQVRENLW
jgi:4-hydroxybenzoate polyprenyltransferase